jgi:hypothetical protein
MMASYADDGGHAEAFAGAYVVLPLEGVSGAVLAINKPEIESRGCAHLYQCRSWRLNDKSI